jgi:hypothetical protein
MEIQRHEGRERWKAMPLYCWIRELGSIKELEPDSRTRGKPTGGSIADEVLERFFRLYKVKIKSAKFVDIVDRCIRRYRTDYKFIRNDIKMLIRHRDEYNGHAFIVKDEYGYNVITAKQSKKRKKEERTRLIKIERSIRDEAKDEDDERKLFNDLITIDELVVKLKGFFTKKDILFFARERYMPYHTLGGKHVGYRYKEVVKWIVENATRYSHAGTNVHPAIIRFRSRVKKEAKHLIPDTLKDIVNLTPMEIGYPSGVYFLCQDEKVVYVGQSANPSARIPHHYKDKKFNRVYLIPVPEQRLLQVEHRYIKQFQPLYNKT